MKTKITFKNSLTTAVIAVMLLFGFHAKAQTYVYNETTSSGIFFWQDGSVVSNPVSDAVNSSANCIVSGTIQTWSQIQLFPNPKYTPVSGDKLYISVYNPNGAGPGQVQFRYTGSGSWEFGANVTYGSGSDTGWMEYTVDLTNHVGNEIDQVILMPAGDSASEIYIDNIYFGQTSVLAAQNTIVYDETTNSGIYFWPLDGSEVTNPVSDAVNSSANCAVSSTAGTWSQIQYFPTYTPVSGEKLFFSVYDPSNAGKAQIKFEYTSNPGAWVDGGDVTYVSGTDTGWQEQSISLTPNAGNEISKIIIMPGYDTSSAVYIDNIYFGTSSTLPVPQNPIVYDETTSSGIYFWPLNGSQVSNPVSDAVNSSANCAVPSTDGAWSQIQYFPTYTPVSGEKLFFSVYDPSNAGKAQIKFEYTSNPGAWVDGGDVTYVSGTNTGWQEQSISLTPNAGNEISKIIIMPGYDTSSAVYIDNIYFGTTSTLSTNSVAQVNNRVYITKEGRIQFVKEQNNTLLSVYDLMGRLILQEKINGKQGEKILNHKGIYILKIQSDYGVSSQKIIFN